MNTTFGGARTYNFHMSGAWVIFQVHISLIWVSSYVWELFSYTPSLKKNPQRKSQAMIYRDLRRDTFQKKCDYRRNSCNISTAESAVWAATPNWNQQCQSSTYKREIYSLYFSTYGFTDLKGTNQTPTQKHIILQLLMSSKMSWKYMDFQHSKLG